MFCTNCGYQMSDDSKFCGECGTKVEVMGQGVNQRQAPPPVSPTPIRDVYSRVENQRVQPMLEPQYQTQYQPPPQYAQPQYAQSPIPPPIKKKPLYKRVWFWLLVVFVGIPVFSVMLNSNGVSKTEYDKIVVERDLAIEERDAVTAKLQSAEQEIDSLNLETNDLSESNYKLQKRVGDLELICEENGLVVSEDKIKELAEAEAAKSDFVKFQESAESVTYDELRRNPDKYKSIPIIITVYVKDEDVDKMFGILQGGYLCTINGEELAVYDNRAVKEPRLRKGDTAVIYGYSGGLAKMQQKQEGLILDKVVDEWYIPSVNIEYIVI